MSKIAYLVAIIVVTTFPSSPAPLYAEETQVAHDAVLKQVEQLENLRQNNPQAYRQMIDQKKAALRQELQQMEGNRHSRFHQFVAQNQNHRLERLQNFREQHPEAFQRFMNNRMERLQNMAEKNPQRFQNFLNNHPHFRERIANFKTQNGMQAGQFKRKGGQNQAEGLQQGRPFHENRSNFREQRLDRNQRQQMTQRGGMTRPQGRRGRR